MRLNDWEQRLGEVIQVWQGKTFEWGKTDCFWFLGACLEAVLGYDPTEPWRASYSDFKSAIQLLHAVSIVDELTTVFGDPVHVALARRGDVVYANDEEEGPQFGICVGE